jgi:branched-subunit amino acid aminotransferase/4-amino-4-deoxychorismate lyase
MRVEARRVRGLSQHLERLVSDCRAVFGAGLDRDRVRQYVRRAVEDTAGPLVVRVTIFDPALDLGRPGAPAEPHVLVTTRSAASLPQPPMRIKSVAYRRDLPLVKHIGLFGQVWCRRQAQLDGFDDALFIDHASFVYEGPTWNIGFFDGDRVVWPNADVLPGVTMRLLKQIHDSTITAPVSLSDMPGMQAAFATNTTVGVRPVSTIDGISLPGDHEIFEALRKEYEEIPAEKI